MDIGSAVGRDEGLSEEKLIALSDFENTEVFSKTEKLCLRYAVAMTDTPVEISDDLFDELKAVFTEQQLVELTSSIAWENYRARFDHAFGIESAEFSQGAFCPIPERASVQSEAAE